MPGEEERRWEQHDREHSTAEHSHRREHDSESKAVELAVIGIERRLDELNQLRKEVILDRSQFVSSEAYGAELQAIKIEMRGKNDAQGARIDALEKIVDRAEGSLNTWRGIAAFLGISGVGAIVWAIANQAR